VENSRYGGIPLERRGRATRDQSVDRDAWVPLVERSDRGSGHENVAEVVQLHDEDPRGPLPAEATEEIDRGGDQDGAG
jgi:hypothetical protein